MKKSIDYFPQFKGFGIADKDLLKISEEGLPMLQLNPKDFGIGCRETTIIGVLFGREKNTYCLHEDYIHALIKAGATIMFLDYENCLMQLSLCDGLLLPGGSFETPEWYYSDSKEVLTEDYPNKRAKAYAECFHFAYKAGMPILGICAGMQIIAAEFGLKLYRSAPLLHKSDVAPAHYVDLTEGLPFRMLLDNHWRIGVNSRHSEVVAPAHVQRKLLGLAEGQNLPLHIYACSTDGYPEAIGDMDNGILGVQWHPENLSMQGNELQQRIFNWFVLEANYAKERKG